MKLGGAIDPASVVLKEAEPKEMTVNRILKDRVMQSYSAPRLKEYVHGLVDFIPRNEVSANLLTRNIHARKEKDLHDALVRKTSGRGMKYEKDPHVARAIFSSLEQHPELLKLYHRS